MNKFNSRIPRYNDDSDYTTNAPSYYDDLARKNKLIKLLSQRIWEYDEELKKRFEEWDENLETLPDDLRRMLEDWMKDGTLEKIINEEIFSDLNGKIDDLTAEVDAFIRQIEDDFDQFEKDMQAELNRLFNELKKEVTDELDNMNENLNLMDEEIKVLNDFSLTPQGTKPSKTGAQTNSPKIVHKTTANHLDVVQKTNKGYVHYSFETNNGASGSGDYGTPHEALRLIGARPMVGAYVYHDVSNPTSGTITEHWEPKEINDIDRMLYNYPYDMSAGRTLHSEKLGLGSYRIASNTSVMYRLPLTRAKRGNVMIMNTTSSSEFDILLNDIVVKTVDPVSYLSSTGDIKTTLTTIEFDLPMLQPNTRQTSRQYFDLRVRNKGTGYVHLVAINFYELSEWENQPINNYKAIGSLLDPWLVNGASDYAIRDADTGKLFGSYHGGETAENIQVYINRHGHYPRTEFQDQMVQFDMLDIGHWAVQKNTMIYSRTKLANGQATMIARTSFDSDGSLEMDFGYSSDTLRVNSFRTALTSTHVNFQHLNYPVFNRFPDTPTNSFYYFPVTEGKISQINTTSSLQLDIRFTKFNSSLENSGAFISDNKAYRKFYYGILDNSHTTQLKSLSFSKGLDFIVR